MAASHQTYWPSLWLPEMEAICRGIAHGVSNRVGAMGALIELGDAEHAEGQAGIRAELKRLQEVTAQLKQLVSAPRPEPEALTLAELCGEALRLHGLRLDLRDVPCAVVADQDVAVRANRVQLLQLLLVLLARSGRRATGPLQLTVSGTDAESRVLLSGLEGAPASHGSPELHAFARELGATLVEGGAEVSLVLPSLQELRRREKTESRGGGPLTPPRPPAA